MKKLILLLTLLFAFTISAQQKKQYRSAKTGQYVTKAKAEKSPSTTYSTPRKSKTKSK
ncbi:hypothetical protein MW871_14960 [Flavobacterium sp. I-SCBP12n]|uniref:Uncharacterized protein n=1 Tax=Flavobacterium pygoscelis TaxID=2893176 RepID=A0A9X1XWY9_9FLAO|nr:hypothetical protein [Flavobacterium pygoscelis]MCK8143188.1 hypothetical protein [Flavobacterium pygoscelis]